MSEDEFKGFRVRDRRRIAEDGELRPDEEETSSSAPREPDRAERPEPRSFGPAAGPSGAAGSSGVRSVDFSALVLSIGTNAAMCLSGDSGDDRIPGQVDLKGAAQHIDVLALLEEKTRGNLSAEESTLLTELLRDLRLGYVQVAQAVPNVSKPRG